MKKTKTFAKKLALSKATVANLTKTELDEVKGGRVSGNCWTGGPGVPGHAFRLVLKCLPGLIA